MAPARRITTTLVATLGAIAMLALPGAAAAKDRNHDHIPDRWEKRHRLSLDVKQTDRDQDHDHLLNRAEFLAGDDPRNRDSDGDGIPDGEENAGTIRSFNPESGRLAIALFAAKTLSGLVAETTEIECGGEPAGGSTSSSGSDEEEDWGEEEQESQETGDEPEYGDFEMPGFEDDEEGLEPPGCTAADLVRGAIVREADLESSGVAATFEEIELAG